MYDLPDRNPNYNPGKEKLLDYIVIAVSITVAFVLFR